MSAIPVPKNVSRKDLCDLSPSFIRAIAPYQPGKPTSELAREMGIDEKSIVKLASNENPRGIGPRTRAAIEAALGDLARYPDGNGFELKDALSRRYGVAMGSIVLGNGSNDVLELVAMAFLGAGSSAVYSQHSFAVYPLATQARGARGINVPARDYGHDLAAMAKAVAADTRVVFIARDGMKAVTRELILKGFAEEEKAALALGATRVFAQKTGVPLKVEAITDYVAGFIIETKYEDIPGDVLDLARKSILDGFG